MTSSSAYPRLLQRSWALPLLLLVAFSVRAEPSGWRFESTPAESDATRAWILSFESSVLPRVTDQSSLNYTVLSQMLSFRSPRQWNWLSTDGGDLVVRSRVNLLADYFAEGPETYYVGMSGGPSFEWWNKPRSRAYHFSIGGGIGLLDSQNVPGAQGQDVTLNWYVNIGATQRLSKRWLVSAGAHFQHFSNGGMTDPNPGLDVLGPFIGIAYKY